MFFLGLDLSLNASGVVLINEDYTIIKELVISEKYKGTDRLFLNEKQLLDFISGYEKNIKLTCIESPAFKAEGNLVDLGKWAGCVELALYKLGIKNIWASPSQGKKYASGKYDKNSSKAVIIKNVYKNFNEDFDNDNLCDAYVLARIAHDFYCMYIAPTKIELDLTHPQIEVMKKLYSTYQDGKKGQLL